MHCHCRISSNSNFIRMKPAVIVTPVRRIGYQYLWRHPIMHAMSMRFYSYSTCSNCFRVC